MADPVGATPPAPNKLIVPIQEGQQPQGQGDKIEDIVASVMGVLKKKKVDSDKTLRDEIDKLIDLSSGKKKGKYSDEEDKNRKGWKKWLYGGWQGIRKLSEIGNNYLKKMSANSLLGWLAALAMLAMFDPNGTFIAGFIDMFADLIIMLIDLFVSLIPAMINVLMVAVPKIAMALGRAFMKVLSAMFTSLGKSNSFLEFVLKLVFFGIIIFKMVSVLAPLFSILGVALGLLLTPVGLLILAFVGLAYSFQQAYKRSQAVRDAVASMFSMLKEKAMGLWQSIKKLWDRITGAFTRIKEALFGKSEGEQDSFWVKTIEVLGDVIGGVIDGISWAIENVLGPVIDILADIIVIIIKLFKWLQPMFKWIYEAVMNQIRPAFRAIGEIFAGVAKFFKDLASASSFGDVAKIIGNAFLEAGVWLRNRLQDLFEGMINSLLRMIPKTLGGYSSAENKAQKDVAEFLNKKIGLSGAGENQAIDLIEAIREAKKGNVDFNKLQKTEDYSKLLGKDFDDLIRLAKNDAEKERLKGLIANLSQLDFKEDKGEALQQLGDAFDKVGDKIVASFDKKSGRVTNTQPYQEMKEIVRKK